MTLFLLFAVAVLQTTPSKDAATLVHEIQRTIDRDGGRGAEKGWRAALQASPRDLRAILAVATFERARYRYERADSLYEVLLQRASTAGSDWGAMARLGMAQWRSLGSDPVRADSLFVGVREEARQAGHLMIEGDALLGLAQLRQRSMGPKAGRQLLATWWELIPRPAPADSAQYLCQSGALDEQMGDTTGIRRVFRGTAIAERNASWRVAGSCRLLEAQSAERRGYTSGAGGSARQALQHFERIGFDAGTALASQWFGYAEVRAQRYASGRLLLEQAIRAARVTRFESVEAWARSGLAQLYLELGDVGEARRQAGVAAASHHRRNDRWGLATSRAFEAQALEAAGELREARARHSDAVAAFAAAGLPLNGLSSLVARANIELRLGMLDSAERSLDAAAAVGRSNEGWRRERPIHLAELSLRRGRLAEADSIIRSARSGYPWRSGENTLHTITFAALEAVVALQRGRLAAADTAVEAVTAALDQWRGKAKNADFTTALAQLRNNRGRLSDLYPEIVRHLAARGQFELAFAFVERIRARSIVERRLQIAVTLRDSAQAERARNRGPDATTVASLSDVQRALRPREALVSYTLGLDDTPTTALVISRDTAFSLAMPSRDSLVTDIGRFAQLAAAGTEAVGPSRRLGKALLAPVLAALPSTINRLLLSPDGDLHRVPFDALQLPDGGYALERVTISMVPSASVAVVLRASPATSGTEVVAIGDPRFRVIALSSGATDGRLTSMDRSGFDGVRLKRLPYSRDEAIRVASYGTRKRLLLDDAAGESAVKSRDWSTTAVLHFATHAIVDADSPSKTALALSPDARADGFLTPSELATLRLSSPLVVLSACHSLGGQVMGGEGLRGLTAPLLEAGARAIVATHWSIGDRSVVPFIDRFYAAMAAGAAVDEALRQAKLAAIRDGVNIADWGGFAVIGDGSMRLPLRASAAAPSPWLRNITQALRDTSGS